MTSHWHAETKRLREVLQLRNASPRTIYSYTFLLEDFLDRSGGKMDRAAVESYLQGLRKRGASPNTVQWRFYALRGCFRALKEPWEFDRGDAPKGEEPKRPTLKPEEVEALLEAARGLGAREYALVRVSAVTGCRRIELSQMNRSDLGDGVVHVRTAKGGHRRARPLDPETLQAVRAYLTTRRDRDPALWVGETGGRLSPNSTSNLFARVKRAAGVKRRGVGTHSLRRALVTMLSREGWPDSKVAEFLGWRSPAMVMVYSRLEPGEVQTDFRRVHPFFREARGRGK